MNTQELRLAIVEMLLTHNRNSYNDVDIILNDAKAVEKYVTGDDEMVKAQSVTLNVKKYPLTADEKAMKSIGDKFPFGVYLLHR